MPFASPARRERADRTDSPNRFDRKVREVRDRLRSALCHRMPDDRVDLRALPELRFGDESIRLWWSLRAALREPDEHRGDRPPGRGLAQHRLVRAQRQADRLAGDPGPDPAGHRRVRLPPERRGARAQGRAHPHDRAVHPAAGPPADVHATGVRRQRARGRGAGGPRRPRLPLRRPAGAHLQPAGRRPPGRRSDPDGDQAVGSARPAPAEGEHAVRHDRPHRPTGRHLVGGRRLPEPGRALRAASGRPRPPRDRTDQPVHRAAGRRLRSGPAGSPGQGSSHSA